MSPKQVAIIKYIESIGFRCDIEDYIWYHKDNGARRVAVSEYSAHGVYSIYYTNGFDGNGKWFRTAEELKEILKNGISNN